MVCYILKSAHKNPDDRVILDWVSATNDEEAWISSQRVTNRINKEVYVYVSGMCVGKLVPAYA